MGGRILGLFSVIMRHVATNVQEEVARFRTLADGRETEYTWP